MVTLRPVILALLLALAAPAAAIPSSAPMAQSSATVATVDNQVYAPENTSAVLTLGEDADETRAFATTSLDLGTSLSIQKDEMDRRLVTRSFGEGFSQLDSRESKRDLLLRYWTELESRTTTLEKRERTARQGFRNGSVSADEYVRSLARINAEIDHLSTEIDTIKTYSDEVSQFTLTGFLASLEKRHVSLRGSVRDRTARTLFGDDSSIAVFVSAADNGVILSSINDGTYVREITRQDHRDIENGGQLSQSEGVDIAKSTYPWAAQNSRRTSWSGPAGAGYHQYNIEHIHGDVRSFIDVSSHSIFDANQRVYLTDAAANEATATRNLETSTRPKGPGATANESGLLLTVNRSYAGGPIYVALQDNETGDYVEGTVAVNGETVGETSADGGLWTLSPAGSFNVSASSGLDVVTVETRATRPIKNYNVTED
jgi:hypothetical protein